jgi:hypothetical protein
MYGSTAARAAGAVKHCGMLQNEGGKNEVKKTYGMQNCGNQDYQWDTNAQQDSPIQTLQIAPCSLNP